MCAVPALPVVIQLNKPTSRSTKVPPACTARTRRRTSLYELAPAVEINESAGLADPLLASPVCEGTLPMAAPDNSSQRLAHT